MDKPMISVVLPNYNHAQYIGDALESIVSQSYRPLEVIVIDDGSTDNSVEIIDKFVGKYPFVRLIRNKTNLGTVAAAKRGEAIASGYYLHRMAADEIVLSGFYEKLINILIKHPQAGMGIVESEMIDGQTGNIVKNTRRFCEEPCYFSPRKLADLIRGNEFPNIGLQGSLIRRSLYMKLGGIRPDLRPSADAYVSIRIAFRYGMCYVPEVLFRWWHLPNSLGAEMIKNRIYFRRAERNILAAFKEPQCKDILPLIKSSAYISSFRHGMFLEIIRNPKHWDYLSLRVIRNFLWRAFRETMYPITPAPLKILYRFIRQILLRWKGNRENER